MILALRRFAATFLLTSATAALAACGGSGGGGGESQGIGHGDITLTGMTPNPVQGCEPVPFQITGTNFETVTGVTAKVTFRAILPVGIQPFGRGSTDHASVTANITSDTTIDGLTPPIVICGIPSITVEVDVMLESGVQATSTGVFTVVFNAPTITAINPNPLPAAIATPFVISGTGFPAIGTPATVRFTGDNGALLFKDGTKPFADVFGVVGPLANQISGVSPIATVCGPLQVGSNIQLFFPDGCCTLPTAAGFVNWLAPAITSVSQVQIPSALQVNPFTINGTNFGPAGTLATVRFIADSAFALFNDGTTQTVDVLGVISGAGPVQSIAIVSPLAAVCGVAQRGSAMRVISPFGSSCVQTAANFVQFTAPTITGAQAPIQGAVATALTITGTNFGPANSACTVRFIANGGATVFSDGTAASINIPAVVGVTPNTVLVTTPLVTVCNIASINATVRVFAPAGGACADSPANYLTFLAPILTSITPNNPAAFPTSPNTTFSIAGAGFAPNGTEATVTFIADNGTNIFGNGSASQFIVPATVSAGAVIGTFPTATLCGIATAGAAIRVSIQNGSCVQSAASFVTYQAPSIANINGLAVAPVPASNPTTITINGAGFGPLSGFVSVLFISDPAGPPLFGDGTSRESAVQRGTINAGGTAITVIPPHATVSPNVATRNASLRVILQNGSCADSAAGSIQYTASTLTSFAPTGGTLFAATPTAFVLTGTNFGPNGSEASVRFVADNAATPFGNGTQNAFEVPGTVGGGGTTISGTAPLAAVCPGATLTGTVRALLQDGGQSSNTVAITYTAPAIATFTTAGLFGPSAVVFTATGTGFAPIGTLAQVTFTAQGAATPFADGTSNEISVTGTVGPANTVTGLTPLAAICGTGAATIDVRITFYGGACGTRVGAATLNPPTITNVNGATPALVPSTSPTAFTINGTGFGAANQFATVTFSIPGSPPTSTPFGNASLAEISVTGTVGVGGTTITGFTPLAAACTADVTADVRVTLQNGSCSALSAGAITFQAPTVTGQTGLTLPTFSLTPTAAYTINGLRFAPTGAAVIVRYTATQPVFGDGTATQIEIPGQITGATTISTVLPLARVCTNTTAGFRVVFPNGACADSAAALLSWNAPTITALSVTNGPAFNPTATNIVGTNYPPAGTPVILHWSAATPIFASGSSSTFEQFTTVTTGGVAGAINGVVPPIATTCATIAANLSVEFANPNSAGCVLAAPQYTYNAPTAALSAPTTVDALFPTAATITGTNLPPNGFVLVRFSAATPIFSSGTQTVYDTPAIVNGTGTGLAATVATPTVTACGGNVSATVSLVLPNGCTVGGGTLTFNAPTLTTASTPSITFGTSVLETVSGTGMATVPVGTPVIVRLTSTPTIFTAGQTNSIEVPGTAGAGGTILFQAPMGTLCGIASATATVQVMFASASCTTGAPALLTYNAPQVSAAPGGFAPQNLSYEGSPTFTMTGPGGVNSFAPVGATVNVRFSVGAGTPFQGGTQAFAIVPGTITSATTIVGSAPSVVALANTIPTVNVRAEFEDGSCTNNVTTSYFRTGNRLAVVGTGSLFVIDTTTNAQVAGSPFALAALAAPSGVAIDATFNRAYVTNNATSQVRVLDFAAGTVAGTPVPAFTTTIALAAGAAPAGIAIDTKNRRVWVVNPGTGTVNVIDERTNVILATFSAPGGVTGSIVWDSTHDRMLVPATGTARQINVYDANLAGGIGSSITIPNQGAGAVWTGGLAIDVIRGRIYLSYDDPVAANVDFFEERDSGNYTGISVNVLAAGTNPTNAMVSDPSANRFYAFLAGPALLQGYDETVAGIPAIGAALAAGAPVTFLSVNSSLNRYYSSFPATNFVGVANTTTNAVVVNIAGITGAGRSNSTSP